MCGITETGTLCNLCVRSSLASLSHSTSTGCGWKCINSLLHMQDECCKRALQSSCPQRVLVKNAPTRDANVAPDITLCHHIVRCNCACAGYMASSMTKPWSGVRYSCLTGPTRKYAIQCLKPHVYLAGPGRLPPHQKRQNTGPTDTNIGRCVVHGIAMCAPVPVDQQLCLFALSHVHLWEHPSALVLHMFHV